MAYLHEILGVLLLGVILYVAWNGIDLRIKLNGLRSVWKRG